jgi:hypothetical protein
MLRFILAIGLAAGGCSNGREISEQDELLHHCERVRNHIVELRLADTTGIDRERHRELMRGTLGDDFVGSCARTLTMAQVKCVLGSADSESATACHQSSHR